MVEIKSQINNNDVESIRQLIASAEYSLSSAKAMLDELVGTKNSKSNKAPHIPSSSDAGEIIEGIFNGEEMIGPDSKVYPVPANYASKSKLIEGDRLKLTILTDGTFLYKQIGPAQRRKVIGTLVEDSGNYHIVVDKKSYKILYASVTYFKIKPGDQVTLVIPESKSAVWGAVENVLPS